MNAMSGIDTTDERRSPGDAQAPGLARLRRIELEALYHVGEILSRSLDFRSTSREVLRDNMRIALLEEE